MSSLVVIALVLAAGGIVIHLVRLARANSATPEDEWARGFAVPSEDRHPVPIGEQNPTEIQDVPQYALRAGTKHRRTFILKRLWSAMWIAIISLGAGVLMAGLVAFALVGLAIWLQSGIG
ncbi:MAG: hypothetical protein ACC652_02885 [Acidimicrobiales bacterium]